MKHHKLITSWFSLLLALSLVVPIHVASAQVGTTGDGWQNIVNPDGTINTANVVDLGETKEPADWMPNIGEAQIDITKFPPIDFFAQPGEATYHRYMDKETGNIVVVPSASTLLYMSIYRDQSGLAQSSGQMFNGAAVPLEAPGMVINAILGNGVNMSDLIHKFNYDDPNAFFKDVASGKTNIFSLGLNKDVMNFLGALIDLSKSDKMLASAMLMYKPGACASALGGCPPELAELLNKKPKCEKEPCEPDPTQVIVPKCPSPEVKQGAITKSATYKDPKHPIVVGQDPEKRGVDLHFSVSVAPTIVIYYHLVEHNGGYCSVPITGENACPPGKWVGDKEPDFECVKDTRTYRESVLSANARASLTGGSRSWITGELAAKYPGAVVKHPDWAWANGSGSFQGDTFVWSLDIPRAQLADPGFYDLSISGMTSGTAVSGPRSFGGSGGQVGVYLMESTIIQ